MTSDESGSGGNDSETESLREVWETVKGLSVGDTVVLNQSFLLEVLREVTTPEHELNEYREFAGKNKEGMWRFLKVDVSKVATPMLESPESDEVVQVMSVRVPADALFCSRKAESLLSHDVTSEWMYDGYVDGVRVDREIEFGDGVEIVGECPCGGRVGVVGKRVVCEDCGSWVERVVWDAWVDVGGDGVRAGDGERLVFDAVDEDNVGRDRSLDEFE